MKSSYLIIVSCFCVVICLATCKKETTTAPTVYNVLGTWEITTFQSTYIDTVNVTSLEYPCLAQNKTTFLANGTWIQTYAGDSTCYIAPHGNLSTITVIVGKPGQAPDSGTWKFNGTTISMKFPSAANAIVYGTLSVVNGKLQAIQKDTLNYTGGPYYDRQTIVKQ